MNIALDKHAPLKKRYARANHSPLMNKSLSKEGMKQPSLRNKFLNIKSNTDTKFYSKQHNCVVSLLRKEKRTFIVVYIPRL